PGRRAGRTPTRCQERTSLPLPLLRRLRLAAVVGGGFDAEVVPQVLLLVRVLLGRVRRHGTGPDRADAITRMDLRVEDVRAVRVTVLALQASVEGTEEVPVLRVDAAVTQRCADHRGGHVLARVRHGQPTFTSRSTAAARVDLSTGAIGPSSTSPVFTAPGVAKFGRKVRRRCPPMVDAAWKPSRPRRIAYTSVVPSSSVGIARSPEPAFSPMFTSGMPFHAVTVWPQRVSSVNCWV